MRCDIHPNEDMKIYVEHGGRTYEMCHTGELAALAESGILEADADCNISWHTCMLYEYAANKLGLCRRCLHTAHEVSCSMFLPSHNTCKCTLLTSSIPTSASEPKQATAPLKPYKLRWNMSLETALLYVLFATMDLNVVEPSTQHQVWCDRAVAWLREVVCDDSE